MSGDWGLGDIVTATFAGVRADCKIEEVAIHAGEGDPVYQVDARLKVLNVGEPTVPVLLAGDESNVDGDARTWRSVDNGETWQMNPSALGDNVGYVYSLVEAANGDIIAGTGLTPAEIHRSQDSGLTWEKLTELGDEWAVMALHQAENGNLVAGTYTQAEFWLSTDDGVTWSYRGRATGESHVRCFAMAANGDLVAGTSASGEFWRSQDDGVSWGQAVGASGGDVYCITLAQNGDLVAGTGTGVANFYRSQDNGANWALLANLAGEFEIQAICRAANGDLLAGADNFIGGRIYRSQDNGANWAQVKALPNSEVVRAIVKAPTNDNLVAVTYRLSSSSVWLSRDNGASWDRVLRETDWSVINGFLCALSAQG